MTLRSPARNYPSNTARSTDVLLHELRNPLATIRGHAQLMRRGGGTCNAASGKLSGALAAIEAATVRMSRILDEYQTLQRLFEATPQALHVQTFDLIAFVRRLVTDMTLGEYPQARLVLLTPQSQLRGAWDGQLLETAVTNLVANALKFSPADRRVHVTVDVESDYAVIRVHDRGIGIPPHELASVFAWGYRGTNVRGIPGTGVGLAAVHRIVALHGGEIRITSKEQSGTTVTVRLPTRSQNADRASMRAARR